MSKSMHLPGDFDERLKIVNARERFAEAETITEKLVEAGVSMKENPDHAAIFTDPPSLVAGPLKSLGYINGWDARCYPSPVDGQDYINVSARLANDSPAKQKHWFDYVAVVYPVDEAARSQMLGQGYGNPFIHHITFGIVPPPRRRIDDFDYACELVPYMTTCRSRIREAIGEQCGTLIAALPQVVLEHPRFEQAKQEWMRGLDSSQYTIEVMDGGGFLIQFFVLTGGRLEVALRVGTRQTFNPKSVQKISKDEISTVQSR